jgi:hypothetical protein
MQMCASQRACLSASTDTSRHMCQGSRSVLQVRLQQAWSALTCAGHGFRGRVTDGATFLVLGGGDPLPQRLLIPGNAACHGARCSLRQPEFSVVPVQM